MRKPILTQVDNHSHHWHGLCRQTSPKQNRLFGHRKLAVKYGSKEFREAKAKVPRKRKKPRKRCVFKAFRGSLTNHLVEISGIEPLTS